MSGIIHINGKDYDEEGNLLPVKKPVARFIDGIAPQKSTSQVPKVQPVETPPTLATTTDIISTRAPIKPPTTITQRSQTLLREAVKKPASFITDTRTSIIKHKQPTHLDPSIHAKHHQVERLSKVPALTPQQGNRHLDSKPSFVPIKKTEEMIQAQLEAATAHLMTFRNPGYINKLKKKLDSASPLKRKFVLSSTSLLAVVLLSGTIIYTNLAGISLLMANKKAGFTAHLPAYTPSGYQIKNPIGYTAGRIVLNFKSNSNDMNYTIEQKPSGWTSETLREQVSASNGNQFQTQFINGLTVYFTNENNATWVDRGVLYTLRGDSGLSSEQIASIAASM